MTIILPILMLVLIFAVVATCFNEGIWSNVVRLINVITAGLLAMTFFEPLARALDGWQPSYTYMWDFLSLWGLFSVFLLIFREITDRVSRVNVRFLKIVDRIGGVVLSLWIGYAMVCFTMMTLHTAPLGRNFLYEGFSTQTDARMFFGVTPPDRQWLGFTQKMSTGAFAGAEEFDPNAEFMPKYATRRTDLEKHIAAMDTLRVGP
ncbi:MAG: CvpA family protein [Thermoguttaceae bacterium]|jgi:hypothetical protein